MADLQQAFEELKAFIHLYDPISLLSQLTVTFLFVPEDQFQGEASDVTTWQRRIEFLAALLLARPYSSEQAAPVDGAVLTQLEKLLERYFSAVERKVFVEAAGTPSSSEKDQLLVEAKIHSFFVRGDAYPHQFRVFAQELYGPHDVGFACIMASLSPRHLRYQTPWIGPAEKGSTDPWRTRERKQPPRQTN
jgi:hypothetical protein